MRLLQQETCQQQPPINVQLRELDAILSALEILPDDLSERPGLATLEVEGDRALPARLRHRTESLDGHPRFVEPLDVAIELTTGAANAHWEEARRLRAGLRVL